MMFGSNFFPGPLLSVLNLFLNLNDGAVNKLHVLLLLLLHSTCHTVNKMRSTMFVQLEQLPDPLQYVQDGCVTCVAVRVNAMIHFSIK